MPTLLLFLFTSFVSVAQNVELPFELERESNQHYSDRMASTSIDFHSEEEAVNYYILAYKLQRSTHLAQYFISPNPQRATASQYIQANFPNQSGMALINFLERQGDLEACAALVERPSAIEATLPYRFMAAYLLQREDDASAILNEMNTKGMISDVMKAFGENAIMSFQDSDIIITQGMQDFIVIQYSLLKAKRTINVYNFFLEKCAAYQGELIAEVLNNENVSAWVTPTVSPDFYARNLDNLWVSGIGMQYLSGPSPNPSTATNTVRNVGLQFKGLKLKPQTPADTGLIMSYSAFGESYSSLVLSNGNQEESKQAKRINAYTGKYLNDN